MSNYYQNDPGIVFDENEIRWHGAGLYFESAERRAELETQMPTYRPNTFKPRERAAYGVEQARGTPRATTPVTPTGRIAQVVVQNPPKTGNPPAPIGSTMKPIWDQINNA